MFKPMRAKIGGALVGTSLLLMSFTLLVPALTFTRDHTFEDKWGWIALAYSVVVIALIPIGYWLSKRSGEEYQITAIEVIVCLAINYLLAALLLDMGKVLYATNLALIPYLVLVAVILVRRWNRLTKIDEFLLGWSWVPCFLFLMPVIYRFREGKEIW